MCMKMRGSQYQQQQRHVNSVLALLFAACIAATTTTKVSAMPASPEPFRHTQPNGEVVQLKFKGGPMDHWVTDMNDYTVLLAEDGAYVYAEQGDVDGDLQPTGRMVTAVGHKARSSENGPTASASNHIPLSKKDLRPTIRKNCGPGSFCFDQDSERTMTLGKIMVGGGSDNDKTTVTPEPAPSSGGNDRKLQLRGSSVDSDGFRHLATGPELRSTLSRVRRNLESKTGPTGGKLRNLVILMRWSDHDGRKLPSKDDIDVLMNHQGPHPLAPTGSVRDAFLENSYGKLDLESVIVDWVPMPFSEAYITNGESGLTIRFHDAIREALNYVELNNLADFSYFDADQDGEIDAITFLHSGYGAERGGPDEYGTYEGGRVWSHKWGLSKPFVSNDGIKVQKYHISTSLWGLRGGAIGRIGVIVHEMGHFLGLPDLYDPDEYGGTGLGSWGVMSNSWGFDWQQYYPCHGSAYMKAELGWLDVHSPTPGVNKISRTTDHNPAHPQIYRIDEGFPEGEYLLIENRQPYGLDSLIPQGGLIIYHIDEAAALHNEGFPGQPGWPSNGNHYAVSIAQADGMYHLEGGLNGLNAGDAGDPFHGAGVNSLTPCFDEGSCHYPNTDSYQNGVVSRTNVQITDISNSGDVMTFHYQLFDSELSVPPPMVPPPSSSTGATLFKMAGGLAILWNTPILFGIATTIASMVVSASV